jgi:hypothetical protein
MSIDKATKTVLSYLEARRKSGKTTKLGKTVRSLAATDVDKFIRKTVRSLSAKDREALAHEALAELVCIEFAKRKK